MNYRTTQQEYEDDICFPACKDVWLNFDLIVFYANETEYIKQYEEVLVSDRLLGGLEIWVLVNAIVI